MPTQSSRFKSIFGNTFLKGFSFEAHLYEDQENFIKQVRQNKVAAAVLRSPEYIQLKREGVPIEGNNLTVIGDGTPLSTYVLVYRKKAGALALSDFKGKKLVIGHGKGLMIDEMWLDVVLRKEGLDRSDRFFQSKRFVSDVSKALVPLFFGKSDICLVKKHGWEVMCELNPQLQSQLVAIAESPPLLETLTCVNKELVSPTVSNAISTKLSSMHRSLHGRSLLTITKVERFIPFEKSYLKNAEQLFNEHEAIFGTTGETETD